jgi:hypothetical protein
MRKTAKTRHPFLYYYTDTNGRRHTYKAWARVKHPSREVAIVLKPEHVRKSIRLEGVGDTAKCSMAICAADHAEAFPHPVEGHIDWTYTRAFIVSKLSRKTGLPSECYVYDHTDGIARMNDTPGGQQRLLRVLKRDGKRVIVLKPKRIRSRPGRSGRNRPTTGRRDPEHRLRGAKLRYAVASRGRIEAAAA